MIKFIPNSVKKYAKLGMYETVCFKYTDNDFYFYIIDRTVYAENKDKDIIMNIWT